MSRPRPLSLTDGQMTYVRQVARRCRGKVVEHVRGAFEVEVNGTRVYCRISGRMDRAHVRVAVGDVVVIEVSAYDPAAELCGACEGV